MRILYLSPRYTGHDRRFLATFVDHGHQAALLTLHGMPAANATDLPPGVEVFNWQSPPGSQPHADDWSRLTRELRRMAIDWGATLLHAGPIPTCGWLATASRCAPVLAMTWGYDMLVEIQRDPAVLERARQCLRAAAGVLVDCATVKTIVKELSCKSDEAILHFPYGVDLGHFTPGPSPLTLRRTLGWDGLPVFISTRNWEPLYAVDALIHAFSRLCGRYPEARLLLVGEGAQGHHLRRLVQESELAERVHFVGKVSNDDLEGYLRLADYYVSTALTDGSSVSLLEAMACGLPVIVTDLPSNREWVTPDLHGWLQQARDPVDLARCLACALQSDRRAIGRRNRLLAEDRADWHRNVESLFPFYQNLLNHASTVTAK